MKRKVIQNLKLSLTLMMLAIGFHATAQDTIFNPAEYVDSTLPTGMEIVGLDGTKYLKASLNAWETTFGIAGFEINTSELNRFKVKAKYVVGQGGYTIDQINNFIQIANSDYTKSASAASAASAEITEYIAEINSSFTVTQLQFAGQEIVSSDWTGLVGDTMYVGVIEAYYEEVAVVFATPRKIIDAYPVDEEGIELDGFDSEESWLSISSYTPIVNTDSSINPEAEFQGEMLACYDDNYLYLFLNITDNTATEYDGSNSLQKDGVQVYFDVRNQLLEGERQPLRQHQITIPFTTVSGDESFTSYSEVDMTAYYANAENDYYGDYACQFSSNGYTMEIRVPWAAMYYNADDIDSWEKCLDEVSLSKSDLVGFEIQMNDYDPLTSEREHITTWSSNTSDAIGAFENSGVWGAIRLFKPNVGLEEASANKSFSMYPNPSSTSITVEATGMETITVFDVTGRVVLVQAINASSVTIDVGSLNTGIYLIQIDSKAGTTVQKLRVN